SLFYHCYHTHPALHSFPTRRSSDLLLIEIFPVAPGTVVAPYNMADNGKILRDQLTRAVPIPVERQSRKAAESCRRAFGNGHSSRSEEHTSELQSRENLVCRLLLEKK